MGFGTRILDWSAENCIYGEGQSAPTLLFRQILDAVDAAGSLSRNGQTTGYRAISRVVTEAVWYLEYMLREDVRNRCYAYHVDHIMNRISWYMQLDPETQQGKQFRHEIKQDCTLPDNSYTDIDLPRLRGAIENLNQLLSKEPYANTRTHWDAVKRKRNGRRPKWYMLYDGPENLKNLASSLGRDAQYAMYRFGSETTHSSNALGGILSLQSGGAAITPIRWPEGIDSEISVLASHAVQALRYMVEHFCPKKNVELQYWYHTDYRAIHRRFLSGNCFNFEGIHRETFSSKDNR